MRPVHDVSSTPLLPPNTNLTLLFNVPLEGGRCVDSSDTTIKRRAAMKSRSIWAAAAAYAACMSGALAQDSSVTLYGVADVFAEYGKAGTAAASSTIKRVQSGGANASRLGVRGSEDLGGGLRAAFQIEHGLLLDSGKPASSTSFWNRQSWVGLATPWGTLSGGRQYSPLLSHQDFFDPSFNTTGYGSPYNSGVIRTVSRVDNSVLYLSPKFADVTVAAMVGLGEVSNSLRAGSSYFASARYVSGPVGAGFVYAKQFKADAAHEDKTIWNLAGSYKFGDLTLMGAIQRTKNDSQALNVQDDRDEFLLGGTCIVGAGEVRAAYGQGKVKNVSESTAKHYSLGYLYNLSKRTALWTAVQEIDNPTNLAYRTTGFTFDAIEGGIPAGAGVKARAFAVGLRHRF